jgi:hypothetical protein
MVIAFFPGGGGNRYLQMLMGNEWQQLGVSYDFKNHDQQFDYRYLLDDVSEADSKYILTHCMNSARLLDLFPNRKIIFIRSDLKQSLKREWMLHGHKRFLKKQINAIPRLEHYRAIKSPDWPEITEIAQMELLPQNVLQEIDNDYKKLNENAADVPGILGQLTKECTDEINSAYEIIRWHRDYYQNLKVDFSAATKIVDLVTVDPANDFSLVMTKELVLYQSTIFDRVWNKINE